MGLFKRKRKKDAGPFCTAVVAAAGSSTRMEGEDKLMLPLDGEPVILHTLWALERCPLIHEIIVVTREERIVPIGSLCRAQGLTKVTKLILGGETRAQSVQNGVMEASDRAELIAIQDGARPLVTERVLEDVLQAAARCGAAAPAVPVKDTVKRAEGGVVVDTPDRASLFAVQTPQVFQAALIRAALQKAVEEGAALTDDCAAVERLGMKVTLTQGAEDNVKITTPSDLAVAEALLQWRRGL